MILKNLHIENYGPFSTPVDLKIDPNVTVLTGQNDVGKTAILHLIELICSGRRAAEDDVNYYRIPDSSVQWDNDREVKCFATFELTEKTSIYVVTDGGGALPAGDEIDILFQLTVGEREVIN